MATDGVWGTEGGGWGLLRGASGIINVIFVPPLGIAEMRVGHHKLQADAGTQARCDAGQQTQEHRQGVTLDT